jgi:hypothetical protein
MRSKRSKWQLWWLLSSGQARLNELLPPRAVSACSYTLAFAQHRHNL